MSTEKMREEFEAWFEEKNHRRQERGWLPYTAHEKNLMRFAWDESRAALVVELPAAEPGNSYAEQMRDDCKAAIEAVGVSVRVKP